MQDELKIRHVHLFEFEDFAWFPEVIRSGGTDYLRYFLLRTELYEPVIALLNEHLSKTDQTNILDLCSGGGGYMERLSAGLRKLGRTDCKITLTDKFPNLEAFNLIKRRNGGQIDFCETPVDVFHVPKNLSGFRVMFSAVHHFKPEQVRSILQDAVNANAPIGIFDGSENKFLAIPGMLVVHPLAFLTCTPLFRPFKWSRLFFTYMLPLIPLYTIWDGAVSVIRIYSPKQLKQIADSVNSNYTWIAGKKRNRLGIHCAYLIGYPSS